MKQKTGILVMAFSLLFSSDTLLAATVTTGTQITPPVETRLERLERRIGRLTDLMLKIDALKRENSQLLGKIELQNHAIENLKKRQRVLYIDLDSRLTSMQEQLKKQNEMAAVSSEPEKPAVPVETGKPLPTEATRVKPEPAVAASPEDKVLETGKEEADYHTAFNLLLPQRRYDKAIVALSDFLKNYPRSQFADNAQYWLAEAYYGAKKYPEALVQFKKVVEDYPESQKTPGALLKIGYLQHSGGQLLEARETLQNLIKRFPGTTPAKLAKKRIERINRESH